MSRRLLLAIAALPLLLIYAAMVLVPVAMLIGLNATACFVLWNLVIVPAVPLLFLQPLTYLQAFIVGVAVVATAATFKHV